MPKSIPAAISENRFLRDREVPPLIGQGIENFEATGENLRREFVPSIGPAPFGQRPSS
jgi:hypothetical protein